MNTASATSTAAATASAIFPAVAAPLCNQAHARSLLRTGQWIILGAVVPIAAWMALAPLSMAVVAPAFVKVDLNRRPVQHLEGGIVREVLVRDGQRVKAGEPVLILGDVGVDADRNRLSYRVHVEQAALARLEAEQTLSPTLRFPAELRRAAQQDDRIQQALNKESALFAARRDSLSSEVALMQTQRQRIEQETESLRAQIRQLQSALELQQKNLDANRDLVKSGYVSTTRLMQIEAGVADYAARLDERRSELSRAGQRLGDTDLKIKSAQNAYMQAASDQLKATAARLGEIEQEQRKSDDQASRQIVVAPASGEVIDLKFTSPGAVVRPGDAIAEIVPSDAGLLIEARIRPEDVNHVHLEQAARIKLTAFKYRNSSMVAGKVTYVSGDRLLDKANNQPYYSVTISADASALKAADDLKLLAGMPAEVYIEGPSQTPLEYMTEPITSTFRRAGRQM